MSRSEIAQLIGVYDANGGVRGEAAYVIGKMLGRRHCALCDITHSPLRRKPAWDAFVGELGLLVRLAHLNELSVAEAAIIERVGAPAVLALTADGSCSSTPSRWRRRAVLSTGSPNWSAELSMTRRPTEWVA